MHCHLRQLGCASEMLPALLITGLLRAQLGQLQSPAADVSVPRTLPNGPILAGCKAPLRPPCFQRQPRAPPPLADSDRRAPSSDTSQASPEVIIKSVEDGVNVLIWSFIVLTGNVRNRSAHAPPPPPIPARHPPPPPPPPALPLTRPRPQVTADPAQGGPDPKAVAAVVAGLTGKPKVTHLVSFGGWGAPHPEVSRTGAQWWSTFERWDAAFSRSVNAHLATAAAEEEGGWAGDDGPPPVSGWAGFDGVDLDAEGANDKASPENRYSAEVSTPAQNLLRPQLIDQLTPARPTARKLVTLLGTFASAAKKAGRLSTMVPPQVRRRATRSCCRCRWDHSG